MKFEINGVSYDLPTSLSQIPLKQKIAFEAEHGGLLAQMAKSIAGIKDDNEKEMEAVLYQMQVACRSLSFFASIPLEIVEQTNVDDVYNIYAACFQGLFVQQDAISIENEFDWNGDIWMIDNPAVTTKSKMTFNELIVSKQVVKAMMDMGQGEWQGMPYIAAVFLRKKGEAFSEDLVDGEGERVKLMESLPMDIALGVAFFLLASMNQYIQASQFSAIQEPLVV